MDLSVVFQTLRPLTSGFPEWDFTLAAQNVKDSVLKLVTYRVEGLEDHEFKQTEKLDLVKLVQELSGFSAEPTMEVSDNNEDLMDDEEGKWQAAQGALAEIEKDTEEHDEVVDEFELAVLTEMGISTTTAIRTHGLKDRDACGMQSQLLHPSDPPVGRCVVVPVPSTPMRQCVREKSAIAVAVAQTPARQVFFTPAPAPNPMELENVDDSGNESCSSCASYNSLFDEEPRPKKVAQTPTRPRRHISPTPALDDSEDELEPNLNRNLFQPARTPSPPPKSGNSHSDSNPVSAPPSLEQIAPPAPKSKPNRPVRNRKVVHYVDVDESTSSEDASTDEEEAKHSTTPATSDVLVSTSLLQEYNLLYNRTYGLFICGSCASGFPLRSLVAHFKRTTQVQYRLFDAGLNNWKMDWVFYDHQPSTAQINKRVVDRFVTSLLDAGYIASREEIRNAACSADWFDAPLPPLPSKEVQLRLGLHKYPSGAVVRPAILGLRVFQKCCLCHLCGTGFTGVDGLKNHYTDRHLGKPRNYITEGVSCQTLSENSGWTKFFPVKDSTDPPSPSIPLEAAQESSQLSDDAAKVEEILARKKGFLMGNLNTTPDADALTVHPVFLRTVHDFLSRFVKSELCADYVREPQDPLYLQLQRLIVSTFKEDLKDLAENKIHHSILSFMTNCTPNAHNRFTPRPFAALNVPGSISAYATMEVKVVWTLIQAYRLPGKRNRIFTFDKPQKAALKSIISTLQLDDFDKATATASLYQVLDSVFFPSNPNTMQSVFNSPIIVFLALETLELSGEYRSIFLIPPSIAKVQYCMRLAAVHKFVIWTAQAEEMGEKAAEKLCRDFCIAHLQNYNLAPFSTLRLWMHEFSVASRKTPRPVMVWWKGNVVTVGETEIDFDIYRKFIRSSIDKAREHTEKNVLLGLYTMDDLEKLWGISNLKELSDADDVIGNGLLFDGRNPGYDNPQSTHFFTAMLRKHCLGMQLNRQNNLCFDPAQALKWLHDIDVAMSYVMPLCHLLQGPPPRMTEMAAQRLTNTAQTSRAAVFEESAGTGGFRSRYHKGAHITGDHKDVLRIIPFEVFQLYYTLTRIVRPIELIALYDHLVKGDVRQRTADEYREGLFTSFGRAWDATRMGKALQAFFYKGMGKKMGIALYRHFAIAVGRHFPLTNYGVYDTGTDERRLAAVADFMANHSPEVSDMHYATTKNVVTSVLKKSDCIRVCKDWHAIHGIATSREEKHRKNN